MPTASSGPHAPGAPDLAFENDFEFPSPEESVERESGIRWRVVRLPAPGSAASEEAPPPPPLEIPERRTYHPARRKRAIKARTIDVRRAPDPRFDGGQPVEEALARPSTRAECSGGLRPCPWVSCRYHLYLDVSPRTGSLKLNFPDLEVWELEECCALDVADRGQTGSEQIGSLLNLTRERARQLEEEALRRARSKIG